MIQKLKIEVDEKTRERVTDFNKKIKSSMFYQSELASDSLSLEWLKEIEWACPYIDNIIKNPRLALVNEEDIVKIELAKKTSVASIKNLARNTHFIDKIDEETNEVQPSKILIERKEETYNTYENRFIYTLIFNLSRFIMEKESLLEGIEIENKKILEYAASSNTEEERLKVEVKITSGIPPKKDKEESFKKELEALKVRIRVIKDYIVTWRRNEFITSLEKDHVSFVTPPIKKTNMILKNPNFQNAMKLWTYLQTYDEDDNNVAKDSLETEGDEVLKGILDDTFLMNYFVLDSISTTKKEQKEKLTKYAVIMISQQIKRALSILLKSGIDMTDEELLELLSLEIKNEQTRRVVDTADVRNKFKEELDKYLERTQDY
jgi:exonuclease SbcC